MYDYMLRRAEDIYRETMSGNSNYMLKKRIDAPLFEDKNKSPPPGGSNQLSKAGGNSLN
jgi:hypothetical protein